MKAGGGVRVTLLCENLARGAGILGEHGLAFWIETVSHCALFDTGQGLALTRNAAALGIDLSRADAIVLSHGHYDHVGGLPAALEAAPQATLWMHPAACEPKFSHPPGGRLRRLSTPFMEAGDFGAGRDVRRVIEPAEVVPGIWVTGEVPRIHSWEDVGGPFFVEGGIPDPLMDDLTLFLPGNRECSVIFGCAHAGAVNILDHIFRLTGGMPFGSMIGGLHLLAAGEERMKLTLEALSRFAPREIAACHCTGFAAVHRLAQEFPRAVTEAHAGRTFEIL